MVEIQHKCVQGKVNDAFGVTTEKVKEMYEAVEKAWGNPGESVEVSINALCKGLTAKQKDLALKFMFLGRKIEENQQQHKMEEFANFMAQFRGSDGR